MESTIHTIHLASEDSGAREKEDFGISSMAGIGQFLRLLFPLKWLPPRGT